MVVAMRSDALTMPRWIVPIQDEATNPPTFGGTLRALRKANNEMSQEQLAEAVGIRQGKISDYELGKVKDISAVIVASLEDVFGLTRGDLAVLLWGDRVRGEFRRLFARSNVFAIREDSPLALYDTVEELAALPDEQIEELRDWIRTHRKVGHSARGRRSTAPRIVVRERNGVSVEPDPEAVRLIRSLRPGEELAPEIMAPAVSLYEFMRQRGNSQEEIVAALSSLLHFEERGGLVEPSGNE